MVADYASSSSNNITILAKKLNSSNIKVDLSDYKVSSNNVTYNISFEISNDILINGIIDVYMPKNPSYIFLPGATFSCAIMIGLNSSIISIKNCTYDLTNKTIRVFVA